MTFKWLILMNNAFVLNSASNSGRLHQTCRRQNLCLLLWPSKQTAVLSVEKPLLSMSKENEVSQVKHQDYVG